MPVESGGVHDSDRDDDANDSDNEAVAAQGAQAQLLRAQPLPVQPHPAAPAAPVLLPGLQDEEAAVGDGPKDDPSPEEDILGAEGEYPRLPKKHQSEHAIWRERGRDEPKPCLFGGARHIKKSEEWKRLVISDKERGWKSCVSKNFRVVQNHEPNTCRHLYHAGPHVSMVFDVTQQNSPETGDKTIKTICFLTQQVNSSADLRGCVVGTHYTSLDINHSKGKAVRGIFWHGGLEGFRKPQKGILKTFLLILLSLFYLHCSTLSPVCG
jgi:hypothetical protein